MASKFTPLPWKKNLRKIPPRLSYKIKSIESNDIVAACVKKLHKIDIQNGLYKHIQISMDSTGITFPSKILPSSKTGMCSKTNIEGKEIVRKDLPMITKTFAVDSPNYGDWSYGSHTVHFDRDIYIREYIPPKHLEIDIELLSENSVESNEFIIKFTSGEVLNKTIDGFLDDLLFNLNLLQENIGSSDIFASEATFEDYIKTIHVDWELLPIGERDADINKFVTKFRLNKKSDIERLVDRYDVLLKLQPEEFISGTSGFRRYFGAKFTDDLVVFENLEYGNAIYVMYEAWKTLSQKTRVELLKGDNRGFDRIVHTKNWKVQLDFLVRKALGRPTW